jgi:peptide/nickel transport system substrate-binding protein
MRRTIISSAVLGILVFFALIGLLNYYFRPLIFSTTENIGYSGTYNVQILPSEILERVSYGLTKINEKGEVLPAAAESWSIKDGKIYTFKLKKGIKFHNGEELTSENINLNFQDVLAKPLDKYTIEYTLKNAYSPFLVSVAGPIFSSNLQGIGEYKVVDIDLNGGLVRTLTLENTRDKAKQKIFFYPTQRALKIAFMLGEVDRVYGLSNTVIDGMDLSQWKNVKVDSYINYSTLVSIFYNSNDSVLSNKKLRQALNYALPGSVDEGERAFGPIPPTSIYFSQPPSYKLSDLELSKTLLSTEDPIKDEIEILTTDEYEEVAKKIQSNWKELDISAKIKITSGVPTDFQAFMYKIKLPQDPDQYVLWHSAQPNNITHYKNLRIDKLLEDGRSITDFDKRFEIYSDFQKYLTDDVPASFLYFPREYNLSKN